MAKTERVEYILGLKDLFSSGIAGASKAADGLEKKVNGLQAGADGLAGKLKGLFVGLGSAFAIKEIISTGSEFEKINLGLSTVLGSSEKAAEVMKNIKEDAAKTPFAVAELAKLNSMLISAGVGATDARADILALGNAVAASGGGNDELLRMGANLQQIKNVGKATAMDVRQFAMAGINIYGLLAAATGKTTKEAQEMDVSYELLTKSLKKAGEEGGVYFNGLANLANSTGGKISNLGDTFDELKVEIFQGLQPAINGIIEALSDLMKVGIRGISWIQEHKAAILGLMTGLAVLTAGVLAYNLAQKFMIFYNGLSTAAIILNTLATEGLSAAFLALRIAIFNIPLAGWLLAGLAAVAAMFTWLSIKAGGFGNLMAALGKIILGVFTFDWEAIKSGWDAIFNRVEEQTKSLDPTAGIPSNLSNIKGGVSTIDGKGKEKGLGTKVEGSSTSRPTHITININKLVEQFDVHTTTFKEAPAKIREEIVKALLSATNDVNIIAGQ